MSLSVIGAKKLPLYFTLKCLLLCRLWILTPMNGTPMNVKILGKKYYIWFIIDSETRFVLGFHLSPRRDSPQAFSLFNSVKHSMANLMLLLLTVIQLTKYLQNLSLAFLISELRVLRMTFPTMLLKPLTSSLNICTRQDMVLTLLKVLILWLWCLYSFTISSDLIVPYLSLHLLRLPD